MGLFSRLGGGMRPPQMGQMGRGMPNAFSGNPQFQQQLSQMMAMQPFNAPRVGMPGNPMAGFMGGGGSSGAAPMSPGSFQVSPYSMGGRAPTSDEFYRGFQGAQTW